MNKIKDFIYDKNDIFLALLIICIAGLIIFWRLDAIVYYPKTIAEETQKSEITKEADEEKTKDQSKDEDSSEEGKVDKSTSDSKSTKAVYKNDVTTKEITVNVQPGSVQGAVESLVEVGLYESYDEYIGVCNQLGIDPNAIKGATFTIPAGSSKEDIALLVTQ